MINMLALVWMAVICIAVPIVLWMIIWVKHPMERKGILLSFLFGVFLYVGMQWGVKEHGIAYLYQHTDVLKLADQHYIGYLLVTAFAGTIFFVIPEMIAAILQKRRMSFAKTVVMGLGYAAGEAVITTGYPSILAMIELSKDLELKLSMTVTEMFLSGYERILIMLNQVAVTVVLVYFIRQGMILWGSAAAVLWSTLTSFLPSFFFVFTDTAYFEIFDSTLAAVLGYIILTTSALLGAVVINSLKYALRDERTDSPQAVAAYRKKKEKKMP